MVALPYRCRKVPLIADNTELIRAVARVDIGIGTKKTNVDGTVSWTNTGTGKQPFVMTEVQVWKAGQKYTYMPALANYHWTTATTGDHFKQNSDRQPFHRFRNNIHKDL